jgi:hypothetical protein
VSVSRTDFLAAAVLKTEEIEVRGQKLTIRELSLSSRGKLIEATKKDPVATAAVIVELCLLGDDGNPMLTRADCQQLPSDVVEQIAEHAMRLSGMKVAEKKD